LTPDVGGLLMLVVAVDDGALGTVAACDDTLPIEGLAPDIPLILDLLDVMVLVA
jgi:hypothetical protein